MILTSNNQLTLLHDLLAEQRMEGTGTINEYQQIKRLVQTIFAHQTVANEALLNILPEIYNYGRKGEIVQSITEHIASNNDSIQHWLQVIKQCKTNIYQ